MTERDMHVVEAMESESGIAKWRIALLVIGSLIAGLGVLGSVLLTLLLNSANAANMNAQEANKLARAAHEYNLQQDGEIQLAAQRQAIMQAALTTLTANVSTLTLQIAHVSDRQEVNTEALKDIIKQSRPRR